MKSENNKGNNNSTKTGGFDKIFDISKFNGPRSNIIATIKKMASKNSYNIVNYIQWSD